MAKLAALSLGGESILANFARRSRRDDEVLPNIVAYNTWDQAHCEVTSPVRPPRHETQRLVVSRANDAFEHPCRPPVSQT